MIDLKNDVKVSKYLTLILKTNHILIFRNVWFYIQKYQTDEFSVTIVISGNLFFTITVIDSIKFSQVNTYM